MRLLRVELTRLRWRRGILVLGLACFALPIIIWAGLAWNTKTASADDIAQAEKQLAQQEKWYEREIQRCVNNPERNGIDPENAQRECEMMYGEEPQLEWFLANPQLEPEKVPDEGGAGVAVTLAGLVMIIGATFAGADWASGSMSNQLLFDPRRGRIWLAKATAVALGCAAIAVAGLALFWLLVVATAQVRDIEVAGAVWREMFGLGGRTAALAAASGIGGFALSMLLRSTVGTLGLMLVVAVGGSLIISALPIDGNGRWMLSNNVLGVLMDGYDYYDDSVCADPFGMDCNAEQVLTLGEGLRYLGGILAPLLAVSAWSFRRRDVP